MKKLYTIIIVFFIYSVQLFAQSGIGISGNNIHLKVAANTYLGCNGALTISAERGLTILPDAFVTIDGNTTLNAPLSIVIIAGANGVGSLLDNGTVNGSSTGYAEIQTYVTGTVGSSFMHLVGPTVTDIASGYGGSGLTGVRLEQFNMTTLDTYAYEWDPTVVPANAWINVWPLDYNVIEADGLALTNYVAGTGKMYMRGVPVTGNVTYASNYFASNRLELISNPYPSAINFDDFAAQGGGDVNSTDILNKYWIYTGTGNSAGNWVTRTNGVGDPGTEFLQVGQGFFVETKNTTSNITFNNSFRVHSNEPLREIKPNVLSIKVMGGNYDYEDVMYLYFEEGASLAYDENIESEKWNSINEDATMIRSIAQDGTELAINALPLGKLNNEMITVPTHFQCGYNGDYSLDFNDLETFEESTEIWLEDLLTDEWYSVTYLNNQYTFNASPDDAIYRFNIHFFGPTGIPETNTNPANEPIKIYSSKQFAYILNNSNEMIEDVIIYDLMGQILYRGNLPQLKLNKVFVANTTGYYVVRVQTDRNIYIEKVLITQ